MRNFAKLQENTKDLLLGTQTIGLFVQIKQVNLFKETKRMWWVLWRNVDKTTG